MDIIAKALEQAERILKGVRAQYIIVMPDGETRTRGNLKLAEPEVARTKRQHHVPRGFYKQVYAAPIDALEPGEVWKSTPMEGIKAADLRGAAGAYAARIYGRENIMTTVDTLTNTVEILRLS